MVVTSLIVLKELLKDGKVTSKKIKKKCALFFLNPLDKINYLCYNNITIKKKVEEKL